MKSKHKSELIKQIEILINRIDDENPHHEFHHENLAYEMAEVAEIVYDAAQNAIKGAKESA